MPSTFSQSRLEVPNHLGGHCGITHIDEGALSALSETTGIKSLLDVGCGPGDMQKTCARKGILWAGIDGDWTVANDKTLVHDFTKGPVLLPRRYDLAWSVEFLEHVKEEFLDSVFSSFLACDFVFVTHALPGKYGHHHVNCQMPEYWVAKFSDFGFAYQYDLTQIVRQRSTMHREFVRNTGMLFINQRTHETHRLDGGVQ